MSETLIDAPYQRHSDTSMEAAREITPRVNKLQAMVLEYVKSKGKAGATDRDIEDDLRILGSTARPRRIELVFKGLLVDSGQRRKPKNGIGRNAAVWIVSELKEQN
jgi:hypothetical protein